MTTRFRPGYPARPNVMGSCSSGAGYAFEQPNGGGSFAAQDPQAAGAALHAAAQKRVPQRSRGLERAELAARSTRLYSFYKVERARSQFAVVTR